MRTRMTSRNSTRDRVGYFFGNTKKEVIMQLDTSNCRDGGADPVEVLNRYPGRVRTIHIKQRRRPEAASARTRSTGRRV